MFNLITNFQGLLFIALVINFYRAMGNISKSKFIKLGDVKKIDWSSPKLKAEILEIKKQNQELLEAKIPDGQKMHIRFDV
jgi:hypothetical protein